MLIQATFSDEAHALRAAEEIGYCGVQVERFGEQPNVLLVDLPGDEDKQLKITQLLRLYGERMTTVEKPVVDEVLRVDRRPVERARVEVEIRKGDRPVDRVVPLQEATFTVNRRAVGRDLRDMPLEAFRDCDLEFVETVETLHVFKRFHVVEEVLVRRQIVEREQTVRDSVRTVDVQVRRFGESAPPASVEPQPPPERMAPYDRVADWWQRLRDHSLRAWTVAVRRLNEWRSRR